MLCRVEFSVAHVRMLAAVIPLLLAVLNVRLTVSASHSSGDEVPPSGICIDNQVNCPDSDVSWRPNKNEKLVAKWSNPVFLATVEYASSKSGCDVEWNVTVNDGGSRRISCQMIVGGKEFDDDTDTHSTWYRIQTFDDDHCIPRPVFNVSLVILYSSCNSADRTTRVKFYAVNTTIVSSTSSTLDRPTTTVSQPTTRTTPGPPSSITRSSTKDPPSPSSCINNTCVVPAGNATLDVLSTTVKAVLNASVTAVTEQNNGAIESTATSASSDQRTVILSSPNILATTETITTVVNPAVRPSSSPAVSSATTRSGQAGGTSVEAAGQTVVAAVTRASSEKRSEASTVRKPSTGGGELAKSDAVTSSGSRAESSSFQRLATDATLSTSASRELPTLTPTGTASLPVERSSGSPTVSPAPGAAPSPASSSQLPPIGDQTSMGMSTKQSDDAESYTSSTGSSEVASSTSAQHKSSLASSSPSSTVATSSTSFVQSSAAGSTVTAAAAATVAATMRPSQDNGGSSAVSSTGYQSTSSTTAAVTSQRTTTSVTSLGPSTAASSSTVTLPTSGSASRTTTTGAETSVGSTPQSTSTSLSAGSSSTTSRWHELALTYPDNSDNSEEDDDTSTVSTLTRAAPPPTTAKQVVRQSTPETTTGARSVDVATTAGSEVVTSTGATSAESSSSAPRTSATSIDDSATTVTIAGGWAPYTVSVVDGERTTKSSSRLTSVKSSIAQESATSVTGSSRDDSTYAGKMTSEHSTSAVTSNDTRSMTRILVRFRIVNMSFETNLSDVNSPEYNALNMKLSLLLMEVYRVGVGSMFFNISNMEFTEGSVKVQHSLLLDGSWDDGMLNRTQSALQRTLARSNMTVDSFEMKPISPPGPTELSKPPPTTDQILLISLVCGLLGVLVACIIAVTILLCRQRARRRRRSRSSKGSGSTSTISDRSSKSSSEHVRPPDFSGTALPRVDAHLWMKNNTIRGMGLDRPKTSNYFEHPTRLARVLDDDDNYDALPISIRNKNHNWKQQKDDKQRQRRQAVDSLRHNKRRLGDQHVAPSVEQASNSMAPSDRQHAEVDQDWRFAGGFGGNYGYFDGSMQTSQQQPQHAAADRPVNLYGRKLWKPPGYISRQAFGDPTTTGAGDHQQPAPSQDSAEMRRRESASQTDSEILVEIDAIYGQRYTRSRDRNRARQQARVSRVGAANGAVRSPGGIGRSLHANSVQGDQIEMPNVYGMRQQAASPTNSRQPDMLHRDVYLP